MTRTDQLESPEETFGVTATSPPTPSTGQHPKRRGIGAVVILTLGGAVVAALVMVAVVFAGATERTITSSTLLCFALGWAGLWWLSQRTDHPRPYLRCGQDPRAVTRAPGP